jgi:hypothetical protein
MLLIAVRKHVGAEISGALAELFRAASRYMYALKNDVILDKKPFGPPIADAFKRSTDACGF